MQFVKRALLFKTQNVIHLTSQQDNHCELEIFLTYKNGVYLSEFSTNWISPFIHGEFIKTSSR